MRSTSASPSKIWLLLSIILLGAALRFYRLPAQSLWFDEATRLAIASADLTSILQNKGQDTQPPLYHLTQHFWLKPGMNDYLGRFLPAVMGILLLPTIFRLGQNIFDKKTGVIAAAAAAIMPYLIYQSQQANLYALLVILSALQMLFFWRALHANRWRHWFLFALWTVLGLYTQYFTALTALTLNLFWLLYHRRYLDRWRRLLLVDGVIVLFFLPQLTRLLQSISVISTNFWLAKPSPLAPLTTLYLFVASYSLPLWFVPIALFIVLAMLTLGTYELVLGVKRRHQSSTPLIFLTLLTLLPILLAFAISQIKPIFLERALIVVTPAYIVLLSRTLTASRPRSPIFIFYLLMVGVMVFSLFNYYFNPNFTKPPMREAAHYVVERYQPGDVVVHTGNGSFLPFLFYAPPPEHYLLEGDPAPHNPAEVFRVIGGEEIGLKNIEDYQRVWLVVALDHSIEYQQEVAAKFDALYPMQSESVIGGIIVQLYEIK